MFAQKVRRLPKKSRPRNVWSGDVSRRTKYTAQYLEPRWSAEVDEESLIRRQCIPNRRWRVGFKRSQWAVELQNETKRWLRQVAVVKYPGRWSGAQWIQNENDDQPRRQCPLRPPLPPIGDPHAEPDTEGCEGDAQDWQDDAHAASIAVVEVSNNMALKISTTVQKSRFSMPRLLYINSAVQRGSD